MAVKTSVLGLILSLYTYLRSVNVQFPLTEPVVKIYSKHSQCQTGKGLGSWNFERMFIPHYVLCVMCHMSCVMCHVSHVPCHVSPVTYQMSNIYVYIFLIEIKNYHNFFYKVGELVSGGSVINGDYPV